LVESIAVSIWLILLVSCTFLINCGLLPSEISWILPFGIAMIKVKSYEWFFVKYSVKHSSEDVSSITAQKLLCRISQILRIPTRWTIESQISKLLGWENSLSRYFLYPSKSSDRTEYLCFRSISPSNFNSSYKNYSLSISCLYFCLKTSFTFLKC
jgi:hypothetical protein